MNKMFLPLLILLTGIAGAVTAQPAVYSIANTHSHNDYEQRTPFWLAYREGFGSIEADIWFRNGKLLIGHDTTEIKSGRTLEEYYLRPLDSCIRVNHSHAYPNPSRQLQMLIDVKTDSVATLDALVDILKKYPALMNTPSVKWVISGRRPLATLYTSYPSFIWFDGIIYKDYPPEALARIVVMSDDFARYTKWKGAGTPPAKDLKRLQDAVAWSHRLHKPVRLWDAPDFTGAWDQLISLKVDYINTDHIHELGEFLNRRLAL